LSSTDDAQFCTVNFVPSDRVLTADSDDNVTVSCRLSYSAASHWIPRVQCLPSVAGQTEVVDVTPVRVSYSKSFAATPEINGVVLDCIAQFDATGYTPRPRQASNAPPDLPLWKSQTLRVQCTHLLLALLYVLPAWHEYQGLLGVRLSVCSSVCSIRPLHTAAAGLLLWARRPGDIDRRCTGGGPAVSSSRAAANAGSAKLSADVGS